MPSAGVRVFRAPKPSVRLSPNTSPKPPLRAAKPPMACGAAAQVWTASPTSAAFVVSGGSADAAGPREKCVLMLQATKRPSEATVARANGAGLRGPRERARKGGAAGTKAPRKS